jgi:membrane fusion protein (multidrug efflux system)
MRRKKAGEDLKRDQDLFSDQAITRKQLDDSKFNVETSDQQLLNSKTDLTAAQSKIAVLQAGVQKATAGLDVKKAKIEQTNRLGQKIDDNFLYGIEFFRMG